MRKCPTNIEELTVAATDYLQQQSFSATIIKRYRSAWNQLKDFMRSNEIQIFNAVVSEKFLINKLGNYEYEKLSSYQKNLIRRVNILIEFQETGFISKKRKKSGI